MKVESLAKYIKDSLWSVIFLVASVWGLYEMDFVTLMLDSPKIDRPALHFGLFLWTFMGCLALYLDMYRGAVMGEKITYNNCKTTTHAILGCSISGGLVMMYATWPLWGWHSAGVWIMFGMGLVQVLLLVPAPYSQLAFVAGYMWFMHHYIGM